MFPSNPPLGAAAVPGSAGGIAASLASRSEKFVRVDVVSGEFSIVVETDPGSAGGVELSGSSRSASPEVMSIGGALGSGGNPYAPAGDSGEPSNGELARRS